MHTVYLIENKHYRSLNPLTLGKEDCSPSHTYSYANTSFYLIHYVVSGKGTFIKNKEEMPVSKGQFFIIKPNNVYTYTADDKDPWSYIWFSFDGELSTAFERLDDVVSYSGSVITEMLRAENYKNTKTEFLAGKIYEFMSSVFEDEEIKKDYVKAVSDFVKYNDSPSLSVSKIAGELGLNPRYLSRLFKAKKGMTIQEYIVNAKMKKARMLLNSGFNVSETAKAVGYEDAFSFSKMFKKYEGLSPSQIKK